MSAPVPESASTSALDLLRRPILGPLLRRSGVRRAAQFLLGLIALALVLHGLLGPQLAPSNLATVLTWIHYRGLLIGALLAVGGLFCAACPMILARDVGRRWRQPTRHWPHRLRSKWLAAALFAGALFSYELFDLWASPAATAWLIVGYFVVAIAVDLTFSGAAFCKHVCPVGQFSFVASALSPFEVRARDHGVCRSCKTADCIRGRHEPAAAAPNLRGCELGLFLPTKVGNLDCTFCLDCVRACPADNVAIGPRVPADELATDRRRSAIGRLSKRPDVAALALLFTFGGLMNALAMVAPVYALEAAVARALGTTSEAIVLGILFAAGMAIAPLALCGTVAAVSHLLTRERHLGPGDTVVRMAYGLIPIGAGIWLAHYSGHFLTGALTVVPVAQSAALDATGQALLGDPDWRWLGMRPGVVFPIQLGAVLLGALGSVVLLHRIAERDHPAAPGRAAAPWIVLLAGLAVLAVWILTQPMEMRGTGLR